MENLKLKKEHELLQSKMEHEDEVSPIKPIRRESLFPTAEAKERLFHYLDGPMAILDQRVASANDVMAKQA